MISDSGIHLCCRFVGEERGVHTKPLSRPSLLSFPSLTVLVESLGGNLGARLFQTYKYAIVMIVTRSWACSMRLAVYAVTQTVS